MHRESKRPDNVKVGDILEGKLKLLAELPHFLRQRTVILMNPSTVIQPPEPYEGWISPKDFIRRNVAYVLFLAAFPKVILGFLSIQTPDRMSMYLAGAEWALPLTAILSVRFLTWWLTTFENHKEEAVAEFQAIYLCVVVSKPFWLYVAFAAIGWALIVVSEEESLHLLLQPLSIIAIAAILLIPLAIVIMPLEAVATAAGWSKIRSRWLIGMAFLWNAAIYYAFQLLLWNLLV